MKGKSVGLGVGTLNVGVSDYFSLVCVVHVSSLALVRFFCLLLVASPRLILSCECVSPSRGCTGGFRFGTLEPVLAICGVSFFFFLFFCSRSSSVPACLGGRGCWCSDPFFLAAQAVLPWPLPCIVGAPSWCPVVIWLLVLVAGLPALEP